MVINMEFYKLTKYLFTKDEFNSYHHTYNGYDIQIDYDEKLNLWECDVFDLEAKAYVLYPCVKVKDPSMTQFDNIAQFVGHLIEEKIKGGDKDEYHNNILIYFKEEDYENFLRK